MTQGKIADVSLTRHKLIPVRTQGGKIRIWGDTLRIMKLCAYGD